MEPVRQALQMHRAAHAVRASVSAPQNFGQQSVQLPTRCQVVRVRTMIPEQAVTGAQRGRHAGGHGLLANR
jgi:hypothetical protein